MLARLSRNRLWSTALYVEAADYFPGQRFRSRPIVFNNKRLWRSPHAIQTRADPFLFPFGNELYLFTEAEPQGGPGHIEAHKSTDGRHWRHLGPVLREPHHLSYPFVFAAGGHIYMIPESMAAGEVRLYRFEDFPFGLRRVRTLLRGEYCDTSLIDHDGLTYLLTTSSRGFEIFCSRDIVRDELHPHPLNPITNDPRYRRSGGAPLLSGGGLYRFAQDCSLRYGGNLNLLRIDELSPIAYRESVAREHLLALRHRWNREGAHHMHLLRVGGSTMVAVDGLQPDYFHHKLAKLLHRSIGRVRGRSRQAPA